MAQELSPHKRARIVDLFFQGHPQQAISSKLGINQSTVSRCLSEFSSILEQEGVETLEKELGTMMNDFRSLHNLAAELNKSNNPKGRVPWAMPVGECVFARRASSKA